MRLFISYRHDDAEGYIGTLALLVNRHFGDDIELFVDVIKTAIGTNFVSQMLNAAESCDAAIAFIGPQWRGGSKGGARLFALFALNWGP